MRARPADIPRPFLDIAWRRFFADPGRGVSLAAHFPWLAQSFPQDHAFLASISGQPAGMLMTRYGRIDADGRDLGIAGIGLVCTAHGMEKRGVATGLLRTAMAAARADGLDVALLWAGRPDFYRRVGFVGADNARVGALERPASTALAPLEAVALGESSLSANGIFAGRRGIPPFAGQVEVIGVPGGSAKIALIPGECPNIVAWSGDPDQIAGIVDRLGIRALRLNDGGECRIAAALARSGWCGEMQAVNLAMWNPLSAGCPDAESLGRLRIDLLDRF